MKKLFITDSITIPGSNLHAEFARSSGPGGQNVNKLETKAFLIFDIPGCSVIDDNTKKRLHHLAGRRVNQSGFLRLMSQRHRTKEQNLEECRNRLARLILAALTPPRRRTKTRPPAWSDKKRLEKKRQRSSRKLLRRPPSETDFG